MTTGLHQNSCLSSVGFLRTLLTSLHLWLWFISLLSFPFHCSWFCCNTVTCQMLSLDGIFVYLELTRHVCCWKLLFMLRLLHGAILVLLKTDHTCFSSACFFLLSITSMKTIFFLHAHATERCFHNDSQVIMKTSVCHDVCIQGVLVTFTMVIFLWIAMILSWSTFFWPLHQIML